MPPRDAAASDPVEVALARALDALAVAMTAATTTEERVAIAREIGDVSRALDARRAARSNVVNLASRRTMKQ